MSTSRGALCGYSDAVVQHGNLSAGRSVRGEGFFLCESYRPCQSAPFPKAHRDTTNPPFPRRRHLHPNIWDSIPVYPLNKSAGDPSAKKSYLKLSHDRNITLYAVVCFIKPRLSLLIEKNWHLMAGVVSLNVTVVFIFHPNIPHITLSEESICNKPSP